MEALVQVIVMILGLGGVGFAVWLRGRAAGKASVPSPAQVQAETREQVFVERRTERGDALAKELAVIHAATKSAVQKGRASGADAERLAKEAKEWDFGDSKF